MSAASEQYTAGFNDGKLHQLETVRDLLNESEDDIIFCDNIVTLLNEAGLL